VQAVCGRSCGRDRHLVATRFAHGITAVTSGHQRAGTLMRRVSVARISAEHAGCVNLTHAGAQTGGNASAARMAQNIAFSASQRRQAKRRGAWRGWALAAAAYSAAYVTSERRRMAAATGRAAWRK